MLYELTVLNLAFVSRPIELYTAPQIIVVILCIFSLSVYTDIFFVF